MDFGRILTAMVTPFDSEGKIDWQGLEKVVEHLILTGSEGLVIAGTTGESPTLTTDEKLKLFQRTAEISGRRVPVIAGTGTNDTGYSTALTEKASKLGIDGIMAVTPYYNKPSQEGMYEHFKAIASATTLPVMVYNIPGRCIINLQAETMIKLAGIPNITSVKEASGSLDQISHIIASTPEHFAVYSGDDSMTLPIMSVGGHGVVSVAAHIAGHELREMVQAFSEGSIEHASAIHRSLLPKMKACFIAPNPAPVKAMLEQQGIISRDTRLPMLPLTDAEIKQLEQWFSLA
ncbi:4-hydroxy-tetrahydrodipicolinate synthase [Sinobaca sp. H24]|uniref:4-hydroxy-tetrahydrodipicolinate synthase n=1 Tax=Sinobaca sp. H24 TaxID=2923376 RepID=UPI0020794213|nr:4-hydroxy-tetrahydrodipicolinate synthase [Sinobaca sp. H24]